MSKIIIISNKNSEDKAKELSHKLGLEVKDESDKLADYDYKLVYVGDNLYLSSSDKKINPICADFCCKKLLYRIKHGGGRSELIAKATLVNKIKNPTIIDATAGLGQDAFVMASLGANITLIERSDIVHSMLETALTLAKKDDEIANIIDKMQLINQDAYDYIANMQDMVDVIYLDPMFPLRKKSSLVKKEMVVFKDIVGQDMDSDKLLDVAMKKAKKRVVVKRPAQAPYLNNKNPDIIYKGKANRFDVYL